MQIQRKVIIKDKLIECVIDYEIANHGIGAYEFWGIKGHDNQQYIEVEDINPCVPDKEIEKYIDDNFELLAEQVSIAMDEDAEEYYNNK
jgi:hypothetical protein